MRSIRRPAARTKRVVITETRSVGVPTKEAQKVRCSGKLHRDTEMKYGSHEITLQNSAAAIAQINPSRWRLVFTHDSNVVDARIGRAPPFATAHKYDRQACLVNHAAKRLGR